MPGSPERVELEAALVKYSDVTEDVPIVIGGQEYRTDDVRYQVMVNFCFVHPIFCFWLLVTLGNKVMKLRKYYAIFVYTMQGKMERKSRN